MSRKDKQLLNTLAAQLFPIFAQYVSELEEDARVLPYYMQKCADMCKCLLPYDQVQVCKLVASKCKINSVDTHDTVIAAWFAIIVLDHDSGDEFVETIEREREDA